MVNKPSSNTVTNEELAFQDHEKKKKANELNTANKELALHKEDKVKRADELVIANKELAYQKGEKGKRAKELIIANKELAYQNEEKEKRANELAIANKELLYQNEEKEKRAQELIIANKELLYQNEEKEKRAAELVIANQELLYQNEEKEKRAAELIIANHELAFQNKEKEMRAAELIIANHELAFQNKEKENRAAELKEKNTQDATERNIAETERKRILADLILRNNDLEQFAYIISHNLRAPVANIIGASNALKDMDMDEHDKAILNRGINESIIKLDGVVKDLNQILETKGAASNTREVVIFSELVENIMDSVRNLITGNGIKITHDFSCVNEMVTLKPYLYSIFYNLITNSIKYCQKNIPCLIDITSRLADDKVEIIFTDNGLGIDMERNGKYIFGLYRRFHTSVEGKGMGLFMVKTQVETLGGRISVQSTENKGTTFKIEFENG